MKRMKEAIREAFNRRSLYEMANVSKQDTKLHYDIWIDSAGKNRKVGHNIPRVKVNVNGNRLSISISDTPKILAGKRSQNIPHISEVIDWVKRYRVVLMKHWNNEITDKEALNLLGE